MTDDKAVLSGSAPFPLDEAAHEPAIRLGSKGIGSDRLRGCSRQHAVDPESLCIEPTIFVEQCKGARPLPATAQAIGGSCADVALAGQHQVVLTFVEVAQHAIPRVADDAIALAHPAPTHRDPFGRCERTKYRCQGERQRYRQLQIRPGLLRRLPQAAALDGHGAELLRIVDFCAVAGGVAPALRSAAELVQLHMAGKQAHGSLSSAPMPAKDTRQRARPSPSVSWDSSTVSELRRASTIQLIERMAAGCRAIPCGTSNCRNS